MRLVMAIPLLTVLLAGCLAGTDDTCLAGTADPDGTRIVGTDVDPIIDDHDHWERAPHNVRTCDLAAIGLNTLADPAHRYVGELDMRGDLGLGAVAVLSASEGHPGVVLLDITNRAAPEVIGRIEEPLVYTADVKFSVDGGLLIVASQNVPTSPDPFVAGPEGSTSILGFLVYDISDPESPEVLVRHTHPNGGCHMVRHVVLPAGEFILCAGGGFFLYPLLREPAVAVGAPIPILRDEDGVPGLSAPGLVGGAGPLESTAHIDGMFYERDGRTYLLASHWVSGLRIFDVTDTPIITEVGSWKGEGATHYYGNVHGAIAIDTADGHYLIAGPELTGSDTVPSLWLFDASDLGNLTLIGEWTAAGGHASQDLLLTTHQLQVAPMGDDVAVDDVRIYMTYNHAGLWVLHLSDILAGDNEPRAFHNARTAVTPEGLPPRAVLGTWDVGLVDGHIYATDRPTGLWVFHYGPDDLGDARLTGWN